MTDTPIDVPARIAELQDDYARIHNTVCEHGDRLSDAALEGFARREIAIVKELHALGAEPYASFVEQTCNCGKVWRGKAGSNPASACDVCGDQVAADAAWRRANHHP